MILSKGLSLIVIFGADFHAAVSIIAECRAEASTFKAALDYFKPFEDVVRKFELSTTRGHARHIQAMCAHPFLGTTKVDPLKGLNPANTSLRVTDDGSKLYAFYPGSNPRGSDHNFRADPVSLGRSLVKYGKNLQEEFRFPRGTQAAWVITTKTDQPWMLAQDVYTNSWPLPVMSQYGRSSEKFDANKFGHAFFTTPFGDVPVPDRSFQHYAYKGQGSGNPSWSSARDDILGSHKKKPWSERTTALKYGASLGNGPFRSLFLLGLEKQMEQWTLKNKSMPTKIVFERPRKVREAVYVPFDEMCDSKFQLHIAGHSCAASLKHKLACGSLVFVARNPFVEFWYGALKDSENVVIVEPDGSDLLEKLEYAVEHDKQSEAIARNGSLMVETVLSDDSLDCYWALVLDRYLSLFRRVLHLCKHKSIPLSDLDPSTSAPNVVEPKALLSEIDVEILYQRPADEPIFYQADGSQPSTTMSVNEAKRVQEQACVYQKKQYRNITRPKGRVAFLFRGEAFRNDNQQGSRSRCCRAGAMLQRMLFESHEKMFNKIVADGYQGVDVFGATYR